MSAAEAKQKTIKKFGHSVKDTGSTQVQIALLSERINELTEHMKENPKDFACRRGLMMLVGKRRRLLNYYKQTAKLEAYVGLLQELKLRK